MSVALTHLHPYGIDYQTLKLKGPDVRTAFSSFFLEIRGSFKNTKDPSATFVETQS